MRIVVAMLSGCIPLLGAFPAALPGAGAAQAQVPDRLIACASTVDDAERLACYDAAVKGLGADARAASEAREKEATAARAAAAAAASAAAARAAAEAEAARKDSFGKATAADAVSELTAGISEVLKDASGKAVFVLDNGQIWRQADGFTLPNARVGTQVTVRRGALGSFRLAPANSNRSVQVIRMK